MIAAWASAAWVYWVVIVLMMIGLYTVVARENLVKKLIGLSLFQVSVIVFVVAMGRVQGGTAPILVEGALPGEVVYANPLPHTLMLTAIVVSVAVTAVGLALVMRIQEAYGTVEEDEIAAMEDADA
jgi:multicomponent Na+:H+ antiporter subunit C